MNLPLPLTTVTPAPLRDSYIAPGKKSRPRKTRADKKNSENSRPVRSSELIGSSTRSVNPLLVSRNGNLKDVSLSEFWVSQDHLGESRTIPTPSSGRSEDTVNIDASL